LEAYGKPELEVVDGSESQGQVKLADQTKPRNGSFLAKGRGNRYGACAFSTLEGYAGRNRETELAFPEKWENARPPSRFSSEF
jgi:hypothetical protein